ncbi:MAG: 50S ribosomal protein L24 [Candidatus Thermoplasmatota archaeon]|nr:50S ribosomal protein L24 [Candidatus Thermoplasmatota archaeon]MBU1940148.1 50S ribosomal protein L24 [Candidatus Thermoplasmatota archaeon]
MKSIQPRKQRKHYYNAPLHLKRKWLASHLSENLLLKYDRRSIPIVKGDTVKVLRGSYRGHEDKIVAVNVSKQTVHIEGLTLVKADGTKIPKPIHPSNLLIMKLNLTDKWRRNKLEKGLSETVQKEIEAEAKEQINIAEEARKQTEEIKQELETEEESIEDELASPAPIEKALPGEKQAEPPSQKKLSTKKPAAKKTTSKKTPPKKTPVKKPATSTKKATPKKKKEEKST